MIRSKLIIYFFCYPFLFSNELPKSLTDDEKVRFHEIYSMGRETEPPVGPIRNIAEYERMQGVLIRYPFGVTMDLITEIAEDVKIFCLVASNQQNSAINTMTNGGINLENVEFINGETDSYWTRDYGPWWIVNGQNKISIVDFTYNRPRPNDNNAPFKLSEYLEVPFYASDIIHAGGNYMTDGYGISASSDLIFEENQTSNDVVLERMTNYYGIETYHVIDDPNNTYIDHIDCWGKYLSPTKVLIREVPINHPQYNQIEETATYFLSSLNTWGEPWTVYRVWTPGNEPYTNSLIINEKILVPITGGSWDEAALNEYQIAMPGYEVVGFSGSWESTDALHCRTKGIPDLEMLQIFHNPLNDNLLPTSNGYSIEAQIQDLSGTGLIPDSMKIFWRNPNDNNWSFSILDLDDESESGTNWLGFIPSIADSNIINYYIQAADSSGRIEKNPIGGWHAFFAFPTNACDEWIIGDLNNSGSVEISDVLKVSDKVLNQEPSGICSDAVSDINNDGEISLLDVILLVNIIMNQYENSTEEIN